MAPLYVLCSCPIGHLFPRPAKALLAIHQGSQWQTFSQSLWSHISAPEDRGGLRMLLSDTWACWGPARGAGGRAEWQAAWTPLPGGSALSGTVGSNCGCGRGCCCWGRGLCRGQLSPESSLLVLRGSIRPVSTWLSRSLARSPGYSCIFSWWREICWQPRRLVAPVGLELPGPQPG